jgi:hypothetical protein
MTWYASAHPFLPYILTLATLLTRLAFTPFSALQEDWKENTEYKGYTAKSDPVIWLWEIVDAMDADDKVR